MRGASVALVVMALGATACRGPAGNSVRVDPALEALVPPNTTFATGADIDAIRTTRVFQKYLGQLALPQLDEFARQTGVDPRKDLNQILSCSNGKTGLFLARGNFGKVGEAPRLQVPGVERLNYKGFRMFGNEERAVLFVDPSTAVGGRTQELRTLMDLRNQSKYGFSPELKAKVSGISSANQVWAAFVGGLQGVNLPVPEESNAGQLLRMFRGIDSGAVGINLRTGLGLDAKLHCHSPADAKRVRDAVKGVIGIGRLSAPDNQPDLLKIYDAIQVSLDQADVAIVASISPELEDKFLDLWIKRR